MGGIFLQAWGWHKLLPDCERRRHPKQPQPGHTNRKRAVKEEERRQSNDSVIATGSEQSPLRRALN